MSNLKVTIEGKAIHIGQTQQVTDNFRKRVIWIETDGQYPQQIEVQFSQDGCDKLDPISKNDMVTIEADLRGKGYRKQNGEPAVFNTISGWKISKQGATEQPKQQSYGLPEPSQTLDDDLPF